MLLQEGMDLGARAVAKQKPQVSCGELVFTVSFKSDGFKRGAFKICSPMQRGMWTTPRADPK